MKNRSLTTGLLVIVCLSACGSQWKRPVFESVSRDPLMNHQWNFHKPYSSIALKAKPGSPQNTNLVKHNMEDTSAAKPQAQSTTEYTPAKHKSRDVQKSTNSRKEIAKSGSRPKKPAHEEKPSRTALPAMNSSGDTAEPGFLAAAQRTVGMTDFDEDSFLAHLLFVNGVSMGDKNGHSCRQMLQQNSKGGISERPEIGDLVFFALSKACLPAVAESQREDGTFVLIAPFNGSVRRIVMNINRPSVIRDERSSLIQNTVLTRGLTAGRAYAAAFTLGNSPSGQGRLLLVRD